MANSLQSAGSEGRDVTTLAGLAYQYLVKTAAVMRVTAKSTLKSLQTARMMSVLTNMSDHQLAKIGITRSEILQYAERLMSEE